MDAFLETPRVALRRFADTDADAALLVELDSDPEVTRFTGPGFGTVGAYRDRIRTVWLPYYARTWNWATGCGGRRGAAGWRRRCRGSWCGSGLRTRG